MKNWPCAISEMMTVQRYSRERHVASISNRHSLSARADTDPPLQGAFLSCHTSYLLARLCQTLRLPEPSNRAGVLPLIGQ